MKAAPEAQRRLLDLQAIDTGLAQQDSREARLPEIAELAALAGQRQEIDDERIRAQVAVDDLDRDIARLERDVEQVRQRMQRDQTRLDSGSGGSKELESLQHELASLARRQGVLEDEELELMEQRETAQASVDEFIGRLTEVAGTTDQAESRRDAALAQIAQTRAQLAEQRGPLAAELPGDLIQLYERIRKSSGGMGAAMLRARRCEGCRLELSGIVLEQVRGTAADEVVRCEECRRILVRTPESGL